MGDRNRSCDGTGRKSAATSALVDTLEGLGNGPEDTLLAVAKSVKGKVFKKSEAAWDYLKKLAADPEGLYLKSAEAKVVQQKLDEALAKLKPAPEGGGEDKIKAAAKNIENIRAALTSAGVAFPPLSGFVAPQARGGGGGGGGEDALLVSMAKSAYAGCWGEIPGVTPPDPPPKGEEALTFLTQRLSSAAASEPAGAAKVALWLGPPPFPSGMPSGTVLPSPLDKGTRTLLIRRLGDLLVPKFSHLSPRDAETFLRSKTPAEIYARALEEALNLPPSGVGLTPAGPLTIAETARVGAILVTDIAKAPRTLKDSAGQLCALLDADKEGQELRERARQEGAGLLDLTQEEQGPPPLQGKHAAPGGPQPHLGGRRQPSPPPPREVQPLTLGGGGGGRPAPPGVSQPPTLGEGGRERSGGEDEEAERLKGLKQRGALLKLLLADLGQVGDMYDIKLTDLPPPRRTLVVEISGCFGPGRNYDLFLDPRSEYTRMTDSYLYWTTPTGEFTHYLDRLQIGAQYMYNFDPRVRALLASVPYRKMMAEVNKHEQGQQPILAQAQLIRLISTSQDIEALMTQKAHAMRGAGHPSGPDGLGAGFTTTARFTFSTMATIASSITGTPVTDFAGMPAGAVSKDPRGRLYGVPFGTVFTWLYACVVEVGILPLGVTSGLVDLIRSTTQDSSLSYFRPAPGTAPSAPEAPLPPKKPEAAAPTKAEAPAPVKTGGAEAAALEALAEGQKQISKTLAAAVSALGKMGSGGGGGQDRDHNSSKGGGRNGAREGKRERGGTDREGEGHDNPRLPALIAPKSDGAKAIPHALTRARLAKDLISGGGPGKTCGYCGETDCSKDHKSTHYTLPAELRRGNPLTVRTCHEHVAAQLGK